MPMDSTRGKTSVAGTKLKPLRLAKEHGQYLDNPIFFVATECRGREPMH